MNFELSFWGLLYFMTPWKNLDRAQVACMAEMYM